MLVGLVAMCGLLATVVAGCGRGAERIAVSGAVTYRGQPIARGSIGFYPCAGTAGSPAIVPIADGKYAMESQGGIPAGSYRVVILGIRGSVHHQEPKPVDDGLPPSESVEQYLPTKYNAKTELTATVESGRTQLVRDFALAD